MIDYPSGSLTDPSRKACRTKIRLPLTGTSILHGLLILRPTEFGPG